MSALPKFQALKPTAVYSRVSTKDQEENTSLSSQENNGKAYCDQHRLRFVKLFSDAYTGEELDRPGMNELRWQIRAGKIKAVVCLDNDRISRNPFDYHLFREELIEYGVELHYTTEGHVKLGEMGTDIVQDIKGRAAAYWRAKIRERTMDGRQQRSKNGFVMTSRPAYGYKVQKRWEELDNGKIRIIERYLLPDELESPIVVEIFSLYVYQDMSIFAIVDYLTAKGYPTPGDKGKFKKKQGRGVWSHSTVGQILRNPIYKGEFSYSGISVEVPALVSSNLWQAAQNKRKKAAIYISRRRKHSYLLSGRVFCKKCGSPMSGGTYKSGKNLISYYRCNRHIKREKIGECDVSRNFRTDLVHKVVVNWLIDVLQDEQRLEEGLRAYQEEQASQYAPLTEELKTTRGIVDKAKRQLSRLLDAFLDDKMNKGLFLDKQKEIEQRISDGEERITTIEEKLQAVLLTPERIADIKQFAAMVKEGAELLPDEPEAQKKIIAALDVQVFLTPLDGKQMNVKAVAAIGEDEKIFGAASYSS